MTEQDKNQRSARMKVEIPDFEPTATIDGYSFSEGFKFYRGKSASGEVLEGKVPDHGVLSSLNSNDPDQYFRLASVPAWVDVEVGNDVHLLRGIQNNSGTLEEIREKLKESPDATLIYVQFGESLEIVVETFNGQVPQVSFSDYSVNIAAELKGYETGSSVSMAYSRNRMDDL